MNKTKNILGLLSPLLLSLSGCINVAQTIDPGSEKFQCLLGPSAAYQAGTVLRPPNGSSKSNSKEATPDNLTIAYLPNTPALNTGHFINISQTIRSQVTASMVGNFFEKFNTSAKLALEAKYDIKVEAKNNTHYIADDSTLNTTIDRLINSKKFSENYYFIKESIGSKEVTYSAYTKVGASISTTLTANSTAAAVSITAIDMSKQKTSQKELIICVVIEKIQLLTIETNGAQVLTIINKGRSNSKLAQNEIDALATFTIIDELTASPINADVAAPPY